MDKNISINYLEHKYVEEVYTLNYNLRQDILSSIDEELDAREIELLIQLRVEKIPEQRKKICKLFLF